MNKSTQQISKDFIGSTHETINGGVLTITEKSSLDKRKYVATCSICSEDDELFPYGTFQGTMYNIKNGVTICGCSSNYRWSKTQQEIRLKRFCEEKGYIFIGFSGDWKGNKTKVSVMADGMLWDTGIIETVLKGHEPSWRGYQKTAEAKSYDLDKHVADIKATNEHAEAYNFIEKGGKYLYFTCNHCNKDSIGSVKKGADIFRCSKPNLMKGIIPCRCSKTRRHTNEEFDILVEGISQRYDWKGIIRWYEENKTKYIEYICKHGHNSTQRYGDILQGKGCRRCKELENVFGYFPDKGDHIDTCYLLRFYDKKSSEVFYKIGRSFIIDSRITYFKKFYDITIVGEFQDNHDRIFLLEQCYHRVLKRYKYSPRTSFKGSKRECFTPEIFNRPEVISIFNLKENL